MMVRERVRASVAASVLLLTAAVAGCSSSPAPVPTPTELSEADRTTIYAGQADQEWKALAERIPGLDRPEVAIVRSVSESERPEVLAQCMRDKGYNAISHDDGSFEVGDIPDGQTNIFEVDRYACGVAYPFNAELIRPLDESQVRYLYSYYVDQLIPCLRDEGYSVDSAPSESIFVDSYLRPSEGSSIWGPYDSLTAPDDEWEEIQKTCPPTPQGLFG